MVYKSMVEIPMYPTVLPYLSCALTKLDTFSSKLPPDHQDRDAVSGEEETGSHGQLIKSLPYLFT